VRVSCRCSRSWRIRARCRRIWARHIVMWSARIAQTASSFEISIASQSRENFQKMEVPAIRSIGGGRVLAIRCTAARVREASGIWFLLASQATGVSTWCLAFPGDLAALYRACLVGTGRCSFGLQLGSRPFPIVLPVWQLDLRSYLVGVVATALWPGQRPIAPGVQLPLATRSSASKVRLLIRPFLHSLCQLKRLSGQPSREWPRWVRAAITQ